MFSYSVTLFLGYSMLIAFLLRNLKEFPVGFIMLVRTSSFVLLELLNTLGIPLS